MWTTGGNELSRSNVPFQGSKVNVTRHIVSFVEIIAKRNEFQFFFHGRAAGARWCWLRYKNAICPKNDRVLFRLLISIRLERGKQINEMGNLVERVTQQRWSIWCVLVDRRVGPQRSRPRGFWLEVERVDSPARTALAPSAYRAQLRETQTRERTARSVHSSHSFSIGHPRAHVYYFGIVMRPGYLEIVYYRFRCFERPCIFA